jgi:diguanylate cyclase (GGDEF)-like protein/PAS domain S-box-containing protein
LGVTDHTDKHPDEIADLYEQIAELDRKNKELSKQIRANESLYRNVLDALPINIFLENAEGQTIFANKQACEVNGRKLEDLYGKTVFDFFSQPIAQVNRDFDLEVWKQRKLITKELLAGFKGEEHHMYTGKTIIHIDESGEDFLLGFGLDITDRVKTEELLRESEAQMKHMAYHDALTNLPNRWSIQSYLQNFLNNAKTNPYELGLILLDLDYFKVINDSLGHDAGDVLLKEVARRLQLVTEQRELFLSRFGGDEFILLVPRLARKEEMIHICEDIMEVLRDPLEIFGQQFTISASLGISLYPTDGKDLTTLIKNADLAMYETKEQGRNGYGFFTQSLKQQAMERLDLEILSRK